MTPESPESLARGTPTLLARLATRGAYERPRHLAYLEEAILRTVSRPNGRLLVSMPPRHGKSELISRFLPAWLLGVDPTRRVILTSYEATQAERYGREARDLVEAHGPAVFGVDVRRDARTADAWRLQGHQGGMWTAGVGGAITGKGAELVIVDDPIKNWEEAVSQTYRERTWDWFRTTLYTRLEPNGAIVVVQTRWHDDDLTGRIMKEAREGGEAWETIVLPALAEENDPLGRAPGEALWPERWPAEVLHVKRRTSGSHGWSALYQQRPNPLGGGLFKREWLKYYTREGDWLTLDDGRREHVGNLRRYATVDLAASVKTTADYTVVQVWGESRSGDKFLLDQFRGRVSGPELVPTIRRVALEAWACDVVWIESVGFQLALVDQARAAGVPVRELPRDKDKVARALAATPALEAGTVWLPRSVAWLADLEGELLSFPNGAHDDQVDALADGVCEGTERSAFVPAASRLPDATGPSLAGLLPAKARGW